MVRLTSAVCAVAALAAVPSALANEFSVVKRQATRSSGGAATANGACPPAC